jgi:hypothetical protein
MCCILFYNIYSISNAYRERCTRYEIKCNVCARARARARRTYLRLLQTDQWYTKSEVICISSKLFECEYTSSVCISVYTPLSPYIIYAYTETEIIVYSYTCYAKLITVYRLTREKSLLYWTIMIMATYTFHVCNCIQTRN